MSLIFFMTLHGGIKKHTHQLDAFKREDRHCLIMLVYIAFVVITILFVPRRLWRKKEHIDKS
jgi:hypothetical protein